MSEEIKNEALAEGTPAISKSKAKREARKAEVKSEKAKKNFDKILGWVVGIVIAAVVIGVIVMGILQSANSTTANGDYSAGLTAEGFVSGANLGKVTDLGVEGIVIPFAEVEYTDEDVENDMQSIITGYSYYDDNADLTVADGDSINLDYVGSVDGVEFEGGNTNGAGTTLVIGSGSYIDDFEQQLIGSHPGDAVTVNVTFPDEYSANPDLSGKDAVFECTVNSILTEPELNDDFVKENFGEIASTVEELRAYAKENGYETNVKSYIADYIAENASATAPASYIKHLKSLIKYNEEQEFNYYNQYYTYYLGQPLYTSFADYTGKTDSEYEAYLKEEAKKQASLDLTYESLFKKHGLTISDEDFAEIVTLYGGNDNVTAYGEAFLWQVAVKSAVIDYLSSNANVQ